MTEEYSCDLRIHFENLSFGHFFQGLNFYPSYTDHCLPSSDFLQGRLVWFSSIFCRTWTTVNFITAQPNIQPLYSNSISVSAILLEAKASRKSQLVFNPLKSNRSFAAGATPEAQGSPALSSQSRSAQVQTDNQTLLWFHISAEKQRNVCRYFNHQRSI